MGIFGGLGLLSIVVISANIVSGNIFEDGKEYVFETETAARAGTMDYSPHSSGFSYKYKTRIQVAGNSLNVELSDMKASQFTGRHRAYEWPFQKTNFLEGGWGLTTFSVELDSNGLFKNLVYPSGATAPQINAYKSWAQILQLNMERINAGDVGFKSTEKRLYGECGVTYTVGDDHIIKSYSHDSDCEGDAKRIDDNFRGHKCHGSAHGKDDKKTHRPKADVDGLFSQAVNVFKVEKKGDRFVPKVISSSGSIVAQFYETEGLSHIITTNSTSILVNVESSSGDISPSGESTDSLMFSWSDDDYKWDQPRDLKAREPFFSAVNYLIEEDLGTLKTKTLENLDRVMEVMSDVSSDEEYVQKMHRTYVTSMTGLDYETLESIYNELNQDTSDDGKAKATMYKMFLPYAGTTASAMLIKDLVMKNDGENMREILRLITSFPFHIRRPNTQLVEEFEKLLDMDTDSDYTKSTIMLSFGHLVRVTCDKAGRTPHSEETQKCQETFASKYVDKFLQKFNDASEHSLKKEYLMVLGNIQYGGLAKKLKPLIFGETEVKCPNLRATALWISGWDVIKSLGGCKAVSEYYLPLFANHENSHEIRIAAIELIFHSAPSPTVMNSVLAVMYHEKDYEVINYVFTLLDRYTNSITPCHHHTKETASYFLKYMKQWSEFETDWGFGVSKTFTRQYQKEKFGYGDSYNYYTIGSHKSTTPLMVGFTASKNFQHNYRMHMVSIYLRIQGVAKALIKTVKKMDSSTWRIDDLKQILMGDMSIREREDQPVYFEILVMVKGSTVLYRHYSDENFKDEDKTKSFLDKIKDMESEFSINHQRMFFAGNALVEQPTEIGIPAAHISFASSTVDIRAQIQRGQHRGLLYNDLDYNINSLAKVASMMIINNNVETDGEKRSFGIVHDRVYRYHSPGKLVIGIQPIKKEIKIKIGRPSYDDPKMFVMHSQNTVYAQKGVLTKDSDIKKYCPECERSTVLSNGPNVAKSRTIIDHECKKLGYFIKGEYFDCEDEVNRGRTVGHALKAFMPYNKSPRTPYNSIIMGLRQINNYLYIYPRAQKCGIMMRFSRSKTDGVNETEITARVNLEKNGERLFYRGRKWFVKAVIKGKSENGPNFDRKYRINLAYQFTPGKKQNNLKLQVIRTGIPDLQIKDFMTCLTFDNKYPDFTEEFMDYDKNSQMELTGNLDIRYGHATNCSNTPGQIKGSFKHSTTEEAREAMKNTWYYEQCEKDRTLPEWVNRGDRLPVTPACFSVLHDATKARKYTWNLHFVKLTERMNAIISQLQAVAKVGLVPYWDIDPETIPPSTTDPHLKVDLEFKDNDKSVDVFWETSQGGHKYNDVPLKLNWFKVLRNLKMSSTVSKLVKAKILGYCVTTSATVKTMDNVTYSYTPQSCWTLVSAHCSPNPSYAVFTKKSGGGLPLAARIYVGGHVVEFEPKSPKKVEVTINGETKDVGTKEYVHTSGGKDIFKIMKWGSTYNIYSFLKLWVVYDGYYVSLIPAPSVRGQHCGLCGNFNRNKKDEFTGKDGTLLESADAMVEDYKWKC